MDRKAPALQSGFTLIELVIVITIIGILSAIAFSRFLDVQQQARIAKAQAVFGTVRTASVLAKSGCILDLAGVSPSPTCTTSGGTVNMDGTAVSMVNQYPAATIAGIIAATQFIPSADGLDVTEGSPLTIDIEGGTVPNCRISYLAASAVGVAPVISLVTSGC